VSCRPRSRRRRHKLNGYELGGRASVNEATDRRPGAVLPASGFGAGAPLSVLAPRAAAAISPRRSRLTPLQDKKVISLACPASRRAEPQRSPLPPSPGDGTTSNLSAVISHELLLGDSWPGDPYPDSVGQPLCGSVSITTRAPGEARRASSPASVRLGEVVVDHPEKHGVAALVRSRLLGGPSAVTLARPAFLTRSRSSISVLPTSVADVSALPTSRARSSALSPSPARRRPTPWRPRRPSSGSRAFRRPWREPGRPASRRQADGLASERRGSII
jgi:hypothetical protein